MRGIYRRIPRGPGAELLRPAYHFSARRGWLNDPNGLCFFKDEWHLFFQHNPKGVEWGNMHWGHAVSRDLLSWEELPLALSPDRLGTMFSGSAVVQRGPELPGGERLVLAYTAAGSTSLRSLGRRSTQCLAYSADGRSFEKDRRNPVLAPIGFMSRDPKVFRHEPSGRWIMALFIEGTSFALLASEDLRSWERIQDLELPGSGECPDLFPLAAPGGGETWVLMAADGGYCLGSFDGTRYAIESGPFAPELGPNFYAPQTFSEVPDGRRIQVAWMRGGSYPGEAFSQQMGIPTELSLAPTPEGPRIARRPVRELDGASAAEGAPAELELGEAPRPIASGEALDLRLEIEAAQDSPVAIDFRGLKLVWRPGSGELSCAGRVARCAAPGAAAGGPRRLELRALLDRSSLELFAQGGLVAMGACFIPRAGAPGILASARGKARLRAEARRVPDLMRPRP
ncbi:MAG TPA: glycoside hydrolase family 32 protein [Spirochaetales bacterium]|nr:glycoside hydrolase family 32 protein [Spirochaetales bacterium]HRY53228.1 glycoside hydrolase family 32 protein [Spirochaetia bacterium]HRZ63639.1 glycoside hydrolase family 32 protein [Spirochaetia bacterium]